MTREIRFRAWDKVNKRICTALQLSLNHNGVFGGHFDHGESTSNTLFGDQFELMQYTGLRDKKGVEIYEGDIVRYMDMVYEKDGSRGREEFKGVVSIKPHGGVRIGKNPMCKYGGIKVIGNIYQNPELLTNKD